MIKFYVLNADGVGVATTGYPLANGLRAVKAGDKSWKITDHRSGVTVVESLKSLPACTAWAKDAANKATIDALPTATDYAAHVAAVKAAKKASRVAANAARKATQPEVVTPTVEASVSTEGAVEVEATPVAK